MTSYLSNNDTLPNNNIYNRLPSLNNIKEILINNLQELKNVAKTDIDSKLKFNNDYNSLQDFEIDYMKLKYYNISVSLDIINKYQYIDHNNILLYFYNKNINLHFKNYSIMHIIDGYKQIILNLFKPMYINQFSFNVTFLENYVTEKLPMYEILRLNIKNENDETTQKISIIDVYLNKIENAPESSNDLINFIYFLRKFPLFKILINHYLEEFENSIYEQIITYKLDNILNILYFEPYFNFNEIDKTIHNIFTLIQETFTLNNSFYILPKIEDIIDKKEIYNLYIKLEYENYGFEENGEFSDSNLLLNQLIQIEKNIDDKENLNIIICLYLKMNQADKFVIQNLSNENLYLIVSKFLINSFMLFNYLNLDQFENLNKLAEIYYVKSESHIDDINPKLDLIRNLIFYIYISYCICKEKIYNDYININLVFLKHFLYIYKYFKNNVIEQFSTFIFFACSNKNLKVIYEYTDNNLLDFFIEYYDLIYPNAKKYVIKKK